jgi:hypothetical protein
MAVGEYPRTARRCNEWFASFADGAKRPKIRNYVANAPNARDAPGPMTTKELARHVMAERGLNTADVSLLQLFTRRTGALLRHQKKRGILRSIKDPQYGRFDLWEIAV